MKEIPDKPEQPPEGPGSSEHRQLQNKLEQAKVAEQTPLEQSEGPPEPTKQQIEQFQQKFEKTEGTNHVVGDATSDNWSKRVGAEHHMNVAQKLGDDVKSFEDPIHPERTGKMNNVDIVTNDDYAIECKSSWGDQASPSTVGSAYRQAETRFEPNTEGKTYKGAVVVFPDGKLHGEAAHKAQNYEANNSNIRFCEKSQVKQVLAEMRS